MKNIQTFKSKIWDKYKVFITSLLVAFVIGLILLILCGQNLALIIGSIMISAVASLFVIVFDMVMKDRVKKQDYEYLIHDDYKSYGYIGDRNTSTTLSTEFNKHISCRIVYGESSDLEIFVEGSDANNKEWFEWQGFVTMKSKNAGEIAYRHIKDKNLQDNGINSIGYKKLFAFKQDGIVRVYISQSDNNTTFAREVFITNIK